jgi:putative endonuclease
MSWFVYLIECTDGSIYTGIALDVDARYAAHKCGKGARYTRAHPPARLLAAFEYPDRSAASIAEYRIRKLTAQEKRDLCARATIVAARGNPTPSPPNPPLEGEG